MTARPVQTSLIEGMDRPQGRLVGSVINGTNADLIATIAPLYLTGSVLDVTYGLGGWWKRFTPDPFTFHDINIDGVDFTALPYSDNSFDAVCFDPPYIASGGLTTATGGGADLRVRFGVTARTERDLWWLIGNGIAETARVVAPGGFLLVKCGDYVGSGRLVLGHLKVIDAAVAVGLGEPWDLIVHHTGSGPGGHNIYTAIRARRHHSYLLVFQKPK